MAILSYIAMAINQKSRGRSLDFKRRINHAVSRKAAQSGETGSASSDEEKGRR